MVFKRTWHCPWDKLGPSKIWFKETIAVEIPCQFEQLQILARKKIIRASTGFEPLAFCISAAMLYLLSYEFPYVGSRPIGWILIHQNWSNTIDLGPRPWGINPTNPVIIPQSLVLRSVVLGWILIIEIGLFIELIFTCDSNETWNSLELRKYRWNWDVIIRGHGFESRWSPEFFFRAKICDDHISFSSVFPQFKSTSSVKASHHKQR